MAAIDQQQAVINMLEAFSFAEGQQAGGGTLPPGGAFMPPLSGLLGAPQLGGPSGPQQFPLGGGQFPSQGPPLQASGDFIRQMASGSLNSSKATHVAGGRERRDP
uniref:CSTF2_hinge domain-containing protein n=1 Tax=Ascaris lumbricoides TaxID=6252 RepID=A0A0M3ID29_ASCLU